MKNSHAGLAIVIGTLFYAFFFVVRPWKFFERNEKSHTPEMIQIQSNYEHQIAPHQFQGTHSSQIQNETPQTPRDLWFASREKIAQLLAKPLPIKKTGNCSKYLNDSVDFISFSNSIFGAMSAENSSPSEGSQPAIALEQNAILNLRNHILDASLFFRNAEDYVQVKAIWNQNQPPTYKLTAVAFKNSDFSDTPQEVVFDEFTSLEYYDLGSVNQIFTKLTDRFQVMNPPSQYVSQFDGHANRKAHYFGEFPVDYEGPGESCSVDMVAWEVECSCQFSPRSQEIDL